MKKSIITIFVFILVLTSLSGCGKNNTVSGEGQQSDSNGAVASDQTGNKEEAIQISMLAPTYAGSGWAADHPIIKELNTKLNIDLKIEWVPDANYDEKLNVLAATGTFPDIFVVRGNEFEKWQSKDVFMDIKPVIAEYEHLSTIPEADMKRRNPAGSYYGLPIYLPETRDSLIIRKDWLDKLGLPMPQTIDELYEVAKAFTTQDPDGNGVADTFGFSMDNGFGQFDFAAGAFGLYNVWGLKDGQLVPSVYQEQEWKNYLTFLNKAYSEGVLDNDFMVNKYADVVDKFLKGKLGIAYINTLQYFQKTKELKDVVPTAETAYLIPPKGPEGKQATITGAIVRKVTINAKIDENKQKRILELMDYMLSPEGSDLLTNGIEGVHYQKLDNGTYEKMPAFDTDMPNALVSGFFKRWDPVVTATKWDDAKKVDEMRQMMKENEKYRSNNYSVGLISETATKKGTQLNDKWNLKVSNIIIGKESVDTFGEAIEQWKKGGGEQIVTEMNEAYQAANNE